MKQRNQYLDILRGIAIILMVFGHCFQYGNGTELIKTGDFFNYRVFQIIYSFHLPLFMLLSGYLFSYTVVKYQNNAAFLKNRFQRTILPIIGWQTFHYLTKAAQMVFHHEEIGLGFIIQYLRSWITDIWFLWAIAYGSIIIYIVRKYLKDSCMIYLLGWVITFITPDKFPSMHLYKYMYPFFISGYLFGKNKDKIKEYINKIGLKYLCAGALLCYVILFCFWRLDAYIYVSGYTLLNRDSMVRQFVIDIYRMVIGYAGSATVICGTKLLYEWGRKRTADFAKKKSVHAMIQGVIAKVGQESLPIYILSCEMVHWFLEAYSDMFHFSYVITILETILFITICYWVSVCIRKVPFLSKVMLGGR